MFDQISLNGPGCKSISIRSTNNILPLVAHARARPPCIVLILTIVERRTVSRRQQNPEVSVAGDRGARSACFCLYASPHNNAFEIEKKQPPIAIRRPTNFQSRGVLVLPSGLFSCFLLQGKRESRIPTHRPLGAAHQYLRRTLGLDLPRSGSPGPSNKENHSNPSRRLSSQASELQQGARSSALEGPGYAPQTRL